MALPVALHLYSVRDELNKGFLDTLKAVRELSCYSVEFACGFI